MMARTRQPGLSRMSTNKRRIEAYALTRAMQSQRLPEPSHTHSPKNNAISINE